MCEQEEGGGLKRREGVARVSFMDDPLYDRSIVMS